ncbi:thymidine phosphorylase [Lysinibacillus louembei]|uniref:Pyrimidine-nucleoside phosphorylase n=1 Tax=Lysinibacillus louembei TaxID=1470088 RepID=A0ABZ0RWH0_9BACI|nr:thymidine phosphorylase [Lysinibacillus louembei]WPK11830.1 thymidine phosphorylase [Lysinibacillus louembei]
MNTVAIIEKKKFNEALTKDEINYIIEGYTNGDIPDYQISALLMAIRLNGMSDEETFYLTEAMVNSGDIIDLSSIEGFKVDKHSTGGVGDKVTLMVAPILAALEIPVAKFSGRGLGITGGTVDKLESIKGFNVELSEEEFINNVNRYGVAVSGQSKDLCPADKKLYALRDVTGTVDSVPLIASSIMSKKIASGSDGIVLDVKYGNGAFMKTKEEAKVLAEQMAKIGSSFGRDVQYELSDMNNPLGYAIGNKIEVFEVQELLSHTMNNNKDLYEKSLEIAAKMYSMATKESLESSLQKVKEVCDNKKALTKFSEWIASQGGAVDDIAFPQVKHVYKQNSNKAGVIKSVNAKTIGEISVELGAGRKTKESPLDYDAYIILHKKQGDTIAEGDLLVELGFNNDIDYKILLDRALSAFEIE